MKLFFRYKTTKHSLRRIKYKVVDPRDPANKKSVSMEEKKLAKRDKF